jgi:type I restriction enzyme S subunit
MKVDMRTLPQLIGAQGLFSDGDWVETKDQNPNGDIRLIQLADIGEGVFRDRSNRFLTKQKADELRCTYLEPGDILIARMPEPLGRACIFPEIGQPAVTAVDVCILRPQSDIDRRWIMHAINTPQIRAQIHQMQSGTTRKRISRKNLSTIQFPVPGYDEQISIREEIEKQFSRIEAGLTALLSAREKVRVLREELYGVASIGQLVASNLPQQRSPKLHQSSDFPNDWGIATLADLCLPKEGLVTGPFGSLLKKSDHRDVGVPVVGIPNITERGFRPGRWFHVSTRKAEQLKRYWLTEGDLLISRSGTVGEVCTMPDHPRHAVMSTNLMRIRPSDKKLSGWIEVSIKGSPVIRRQLAELLRGSTRNFLNLRILSQLIVGVPPEEERITLERELERRLSLVDSLADTAHETSVRALLLKNQVLKQAFPGPPVPR